ncbi:MAG: SusC/RagA family TonB-linked outer membrane protein [Dysgonamonadaceae bacterium]|jgi:TonB-linked SusC/RagA family outer membrane protein|nr:SusC/RagA family TonB-linked outer membrane protein [Dysgonamonadaceae bacterium]
MKLILKLCLVILIFPLSVYAQDFKVTGNVISSEDNEPVIGANVTVKGFPTVGATTDIDGNFELKIPKGATTLIISYIGFKTQEVKVKEQLNIVLEPDSQMLSEVVVTGMTKTDKRLFTGSTTKIDADKARIDGLADISRSLEGRAAGVSVQNISGTFGAAPKIRVRGATSIYGNSKPLWVVDGVVLEDAIDISSDDLSSGNAETLISSAIAGINADDIESFQILKDGSATSIYGARAMGGVIVVTTKKGRAGVSRLSYTGELTYRLKPSYNNFNITNSQEQMGIYREMYDKGWLEFATLAGRSSSGVYGKMYQLIDTYLGNDEYALAQTVNAQNAYLRQAEFRNTDWFDELFNSNILQNHSVSITSGTEKSSYYISLSVMDDPGWTKSSNVERYTLNANASYKLSPSLELRMQGSGSRRNQKAPGTLNQETDPVSGSVSRTFDINPYSYALNTSRTLDPQEYYTRNYAPFNIFHELENNYIDIAVTDVKFQGELTWKIIKGWEVTALTAMRYQESTQEHKIKDKSNMAMAYRAGVKEGEGGENETIRDANPYLYRNPDDPSALPETVLPKGGIYDRTDNSLKGFDARLSTSYVSQFSDDHIVNLYGGMEVNSTERNKVWFRGWGYEYDKGEPFYDYMVFKQGVEEGSKYFTMEPTTKRNIASFAMATYSYRGKYVLNGTGRYEGTNKLGRSRKARWLPTWNVAGAWNAHEESWFKNDVNKDILSHGTLKASYSLTADAGKEDVTNSLPIYKASTPWRPSASVMESGLKLEETENSDLTYEKKHELNIGIDLGFLHDRITVVADWYKRNNYDLIGKIYTTGIGGGAIQKWANVASMKSSGVELSISSHNITGKDFRWNTDFVFAKSTNEVTDLQSQTRLIDLVSGNGFARQGYPVRALYSIPFAGLNDEGIPTFYNSDGSITVSGIYFQENKDLDFLIYEGPTEPTITGSLGNTFFWKGLQLNIFATYSFGNVIRMDEAFYSSYTDLDAMPREFKNRWMKPGDEKITDIPVIPSRRQTQTYSNLDYAYNAYNYTSIRTAKGDFIRMKEISLGYELPRKITDMFRISSASVKLQATNLFLIYQDKKLNGQDPEFFNSGGVAVPVPKQFTFTLRLGI